MYKVIITPHFKRQLKPLVKKYRHIKEDLEKTLLTFDKNVHQALGRNTYKVRLKSSDLSRGKSKSFRLIIFFIEYNNLISPIAIYFKGDKESISKKEINYHLTSVILELQQK